MNPSLKKRFWDATTVVDFDNGYGVALDGRQLKTPAKADLVVPVRAIAKLIAAEWDAQQGQVDPETMPATRWANSAIDKVSVQRSEVIGMLAEYGGSDLLCYRADHPDALFELQKKAWDPVLEWADNSLKAPLETTRSILPIKQPNHSLANLNAALQALDSYEVAAIHDMICITGSLVLALAVSEGDLDAQVAWEISRIDEDWQIKLWGQDDEAVISEKAKQKSFAFAHQILLHLRAGV